MKVSLLMRLSLFFLIAPIIINAMADSIELPSASQKNYEASMDSLLQRHFTPNKPGAAVLVMKNGEVLLNRGYGLASIELSAPVTPNTVFHIASVGKQFTAAAILRLSEKGLLDINASVVTYLVDLPESWNGITIKNLLTHTSGIDNLWNDPEFQARAHNDFTPQQIIALAVSKPLLFSPGSAHRYATVNYTILGQIIVQLSGKPYDTFLRDEFFQPLGMNNTTFDQENKIVSGLATPYTAGPAPAPFMSKTLGFAGGSFYSNTHDVAIWQAALLNGKVVSLVNFKKLITAYRLTDGTDTHYGLGLRVHTMNGQPYLQSNGDIPGFHSEVVSIPHANIFVAMLTNGEEIPNGLDPIAKRLAAIALDKPIPDLKAVELPQRSINALLGSYSANEDRIVVRMMDGRLVSEIPGNPPDLISAISPTEFFFDANQDARLRFTVKNGKAVGLLPYAVDRTSAAYFRRLD